MTVFKVESLSSAHWSRWIFSSTLTTSRLRMVKKVHPESCRVMTADSTTFMASWGYTWSLVNRWHLTGNTVAPWGLVKARRIHLLNENPSKMWSPLSCHSFGPNNTSSFRHLLYDPTLKFSHDIVFFLPSIVTIPISLLKIRPRIDHKNMKMTMWEMLASESSSPKIIQQKEMGYRKTADVWFGYNEGVVNVFLIHQALRPYAFKMPSSLFLLLPLSLLH